jgi:two-component system sensor histidine kinase TctE
MSLRQRLLLWLLPPIVLLTALWIWAAYVVVLHFTHLAYDRGLEDTVETLAGQVTFMVDDVLINLPLAARQMIEYDQVDKVYFSITDERGLMLAGNRELPEGKTTKETKDNTDFYNVETQGVPVRIAEYRLEHPFGGGLFFVRVAETLNKREALAREVLIYMIPPQLLFLAGITWLVWHGIGRGVAPLSRIRDAIAQRTHEDLSPLDESGLPSEVHQQVRVINELMLRLGRTLDSQRRFIADATHQLRTPITVLRTRTELALRTDDPATLRKIVQEFDAATSRLVRLANQLLNLSRAEAGLQASLASGPLRVAEVVEDAVAGLVPMALEKDIEVRVDIAPELPPLNGDPQLLAEMLGNLLDNAIRYTPGGGRVAVGVKAEASRLLFVVEDNGPGIPAAERGRVTERFYRRAETSSEGSGLGLAIAREIATLHRGNITLEEGISGHGLKVVIAIPWRENKATH